MSKQRGVFAAWLFASCLPLGTTAAQFDGRYNGRIKCDVIPGQTAEPLNTTFTMTINADKAEYQREVLRPDSRYPLGITERGTSSVSSDGEISLKGGAAGPTWSYDAVYSGKLEGRSARLGGQQVWRFDGKPPFTRQCSVEVRASE